MLVTEVCGKLAAGVAAWVGNKAAGAGLIAWGAHASSPGWMQGSAVVQAMNRRVGGDVVRGGDC